MKTRRTLALLSSAAVGVSSSSATAPKAVIPSTENSVRGASSASDVGQTRLAVAVPPPHHAAISVDNHHPEELLLATTEDDEQRHRKLCWEAGPKWHPQYKQGWTAGFCKFENDCNSPGYSTELACCKAAYAGQISGACLASLPNPPTSSPTGVDPGVYYPDYDMPWTDAECKSGRPVPNGRPTYDTMLACCKGAYAGQLSGACLAALPTPPTSSPTNTDKTVDYWYPDYDTAWSDATCTNAIHTFSKTDRPTFDTQLACCKGAYAGQTTGACLADLPNPPTTSPTAVGGAEFYYPKYEDPWSEGSCTNERPLPFLPGGRPTYDTMLACCKGSYSGQISGYCLSKLPSPPTSSPTATGGLDVYYPDYSTNDWAQGSCINARPLPSGRPTYTNKLECCKNAYGGQSTHVCICDADPCISCNCPTDADGVAWTSLTARKAYCANPANTLYSDWWSTQVGVGYECE